MKLTEGKTKSNTKDRPSSKRPCIPPPNLSSCNANIEKVYCKENGNFVCSFIKNISTIPATAIDREYKKCNFSHRSCKKTNKNNDCKDFKKHEYDE